MAMSTTNLTAMEFTEKTIVKEFAPNFLATVGAQNIKKPSEVLVMEILRKIPDPDESFLLTGHVPGTMFDVDVDLTVPSNISAKTDLAFISYMLSSFYKNERLLQNGARRYRFTVNQASNNPVKTGTFEFYCLKNTPINTNAGNITTDQDMTHASILGLNMMVKGMRGNGMAGMHPLSRVAASEANINALADFITSSSLMAKYETLQRDPVITAVKLYNTACTRKAHQFFDQTKYYCPELAAATLITGVMSSSKISPGLIKIANSSLKKIARSSGSLDTNLVVQLMDFTVGSGSALDAEAIFNMYKNNKARYTYIPPQATPVGPNAYMTMPLATAAAPTVVQPTTPFQEVGTSKQQK